MAIVTAILDSFTDSGANVGIGWSKAVMILWVMRPVLLTGGGAKSI